MNELRDPNHTSNEIANDDKFKPAGNVFYLFNAKVRVHKRVIQKVLPPTS